MKRFRLYDLTPLPCHLRRVSAIVASYSCVISGASPLPAPTPSFQPIGTKAAATSSTPLSVASRLNCAAAFLVSNTSTRMPIALIAFLNSGLIGRISGPSPSMNKSGRGHTKLSNPNVLVGMWNWPFPLIRCRPLLGFESHGLHRKASPPTRRTPEPSVVLAPLFSWKPDDMQTSTEVDGAGVSPRTSRAAKSVGGGSPLSRMRGLDV